MATELERKLADALYMAFPILNDVQVNGLKAFDKGHCRAACLAANEALWDYKRQQESKDANPT